MATAASGHRPVSHPTTHQNLSSLHAARSHRNASEELNSYKELHGLASLSRLYLSGTQVTQAGVAELKCLKNLS